MLRKRCYFKVIIDAVSFSNYKLKDMIYSTQFWNNVFNNFDILLPVLWVFIIFRTNGSQKAFMQTLKFICMIFIGENLYNRYGTYVIFPHCCEIQTYRYQVNYWLCTHALTIMAKVTSVFLAKILKNYTKIIVIFIFNVQQMPNSVKVDCNVSV